MHSGIGSLRWRTAALSAVAVTAMGLSALPAQAVDGSTPATPGPVAHTNTAISVPSKLAPGLARGNVRSEVFVEFTGKGAADTAAQTHGISKGAAQSAAKSRRKEVAKTAATVVDAAQAKDSGARELFQVANAVPGVGLSANSAALRAIATRSDVAKISRLVPKTTSNAGAAQLTKVLNAWQDYGVTGKGVKVGIIDTGIDYTHADFGGPGTEKAYKEAVANETDPNWHARLPELAQAKVVGGHDFVGNDYDADPASDNYQPVPKPDDNPIDCGEHGTHVSGTVAGYGVSADRSTFTGDYSKLTGGDLYDMRVGPGMAPNAELYGLKVFGCTGSTDVVIPALDWSLDPNDDGDFGDHLDIVNLSLGSDYGAADDPENDVVNEIAAHGVLPVIAMGNNGDLTDTGGSPGNAVRSLAVASSVDLYQLRDGLRVNAPDAVKGIAPGQMSIAYDWANKAPVTGDVVALSSANADGCATLSAADAAKVSGKVAWLEWDDNDATRLCGSVARSKNVKAAGAIGALLTSSLDVFGAGISGIPEIPVFQLPKAQTDRLRPSVTNPGVDGGLNVTFDGSLQATIKDITPSIADTISSFSSRGTHGSIGVVKPDVTAPGDTIASAKMGSGDGVVVFSGTSMATPLTAGIAALVKERQPVWSTEQLKADVMNTAGHDLTTEPNGAGDRYGPARVGAGRVDALAAVDNEVLVYAADTPGAVSASFGVVQAPIGAATITRTRELTVQNTGEAATTVSLSYDPIVDQPGVTYSVLPGSVTVDAGATKSATVTMRVSPSALRHTLDPTMERDQLGVPRQFLPDASGILLATPTGSSTGGSALRVPVYGAAKPVSNTTTHKVPGKRVLAVTGQGISQGGDGPDAYRSLLSVMQLGATSAKLPSCSSTLTSGCTYNATTVAGDLKYVGAGSSPGKHGYADGALWFGVATYGDWATIGNSTIPYVDIDTTGDKSPDFEVYAQNIPGTDVLVANLVDLNSGELVGQQPVNFNFGDVDTNVFDTNVLLLPVDPAAIGVRAGAKKFPITYRVGMYSSYGTYKNGDVDAVGPVSYDVVKPAISTAAPLYLDQGGVTIPYTHGSSKGGQPKALVFHLQGASGNRADVVSLTP